MIKKIFTSVFVVLTLGILILSYRVLLLKDKVLYDTKEIPVGETYFPKKEISNSEKLNQLMDQAIDWSFKDIYGQDIFLKSYKGKKKILINVWATWCAPCIEEMLSLSALAEQSQKKLIVIGITTEPIGVVKKFISKSFPDLSVHFKIVRISPEEFQKHLPESPLPSTYIFNKSGYLEDKVIGAKDWLKYPITF